jgi:hypothetical protein
MIVESSPHDFSGIKIDNPEPGLWVKYTTPKSEMYLHERLGFETATTLSIWDWCDTKWAITKNLEGRVVGFVRRVK